MKKETKLNPQLRFWRVLNKYCVLCIFNVDLLLQCLLWRQHCDYAWAASCTLGQLRGLLSSCVDSLSLRTSLYNSSLLYFLSHPELRRSASAHMRMPFLEDFFWVRLNHFISTNQRTKNNLIEVWSKQLSILSCFFFSSYSEFSLVSNLATCVNCLDLHECKPT